MVNVISFFAGCGGSSLGYQRAGCKVLLASDWEQKAIQTYKLNFPDTPVLHKDIRQVTGQQILSLTGLQEGELDILDGSPPCTPFSLAGLREKSWNKEYIHTGDQNQQQTNDLFFEFIRLIKQIKPRIFIAENVKGLIIGKAKGYFNLILSAMKRLDYDVQTLLVNAQDFEVPQSRERIFFIGIRKDIQQHNVKLKTYPKIIFSEAVKDIKIPEDDYNIALISKNNQSYKLLQFTKQGHSFSDIDPKGYGYNSLRLNNNTTSPTITANAHFLFHPTEHRKLTLMELKRLQSFPDDFKFLSIHDGRIRIGNSVPPNLIKNIVKYVLEKVDYFGVAPNQKVTI